VERGEVPTGSADEESRVPTTYSRRRSALPVDSSGALTQVAAAKGLPTAALASVWLQERLRQERPDSYTNPNTYRYRAMHERRPDARVYYFGPTQAAPAAADDLLADE
jgi:hypothetical protein